MNMWKKIKNNEILYKYNLKCGILKENKQKYQLANGNHNFSSSILSMFSTYK